MITLTANAFIGTLTNLVGVVQMNSTFKRGSLMPLLELFQNINVENGNGKVIYSANILEVTDLPTSNSTLLSVKKPTVQEEYFTVQDFKVVQLTINRYLMRNAFIEESAMSNLISYLFHVMQMTRDIHMYNEVIGMISTYVTTYNTEGSDFVVNYTVVDPSTATTASEKIAIKEQNAVALYEALINQVALLTLPNTKNQLEFTQILNPEDLVLIIPITINTELTLNALATLLNSSKITEALKWDTTILVDGQATGGIAYPILCDKKKFQYGYFYNVATSFFDASTLNQNNWLHFSYYKATTDGLTGLIFVESTGA